MKKLNFGCGTRIMPGYVNIDIVEHDGVDYAFDFNTYPYPLKDNFYCEIHARFVLEHVDNLHHTMIELHRVLIPGGTLHIEVPYQTCIHTWASYQHQRAFTLRTFDGYAKSTNQKYPLNVPNDDYMFFTFKQISRRLVFPKGLHFESYLLEPFANAFPKIYEETFLRYMFPAFSIKVELIK